MNKSTLENVINKAISDYKNAPYYIQGGKPRFLRLQSESDTWFIDPDSIILDTDAMTMNLFKSRGFEIANIKNFDITLAYTSILSILKITYDDNNDFGLYDATILRVSDKALPILMPY